MLSLLLRSIFAVKWEPYSHRIFAHPKGYVRKKRGIDMEKKIHLYVSKKHPALWLTGLLMLASVVARIAIFSQVAGVGVWRQIVWPAVAVILFVLMAFLSGEEMLYRTAVPVWMLGVCEMWQLYFVLGGRPLLFVLACIVILFFCGSYTSILAGNHKPWLLLPLYLLALAIVGYMH